MGHSPRDAHGLISAQAQGCGGSEWAERVVCRAQRAGIPTQIARRWEASTEADFVKLMHAKGERVVDRHGEVIGKVSQIACDPNTYNADWLVVKTSTLGRPRLVPVQGAIDLG